MNNIKLFLYGSVAKLYYPIALLIAGMYFTKDDFSALFLWDTVYVLLDKIAYTVVSSKFYRDYNKTQGIGLLMVLYTIIIFLTFIITKNDGILYIGLWLIPLPYALYIEEYAVKNNFNVLWFSIASGFGSILFTYIGYLVNKYINIENWQIFYMSHLIGYLIFDIIPKRIIWKIKFKDVIIIKLTSLKWYKEEIESIIESIRTDSEMLFNSLARTIVRVTMVTGIDNFDKVILTGEFGDAIIGGLDSVIKNLKNRIIYYKTNKLEKSVKFLIVVSVISIPIIVYLNQYGYFSYLYMISHTLVFYSFIYFRFGKFMEAEIIVKQNKMGHKLSILATIRQVFKQLLLSSTYNLLYYNLYSLISYFIVRYSAIIIKRKNKLELIDYSEM